MVVQAEKGRTHRDAFLAPFQGALAFCRNPYRWSWDHRLLSCNPSGLQEQDASGKNRFENAITTCNAKKHYYCAAAKLRPLWCSPLSHGIIQIMKSFFLIAFVLLGISIACVPNKSALSSSVNSNAPINQPSEQPANSTEQSNANCSLTMAAAPVLKGLKLGMTPDEVLALFPGSKDDAEVKSFLSRPLSPLGVSELVIRPAKFESKQKFTGINQITFSLLDGRVSTFTVTYNGPAYSHVDQFVTRFVEGTNLPPADQWQAFVGLDSQLKTLTCKDFEVRVFAGGEKGNLNYVLMTDLEAHKKLKDRRAKARAQATPSP